MNTIGRYGKLGNMNQTIPQEYVDLQFEIPPIPPSCIIIHNIIVEERIENREKNRK
jgi:hypothetical protein